MKAWQMYLSNLIVGITTGLVILAFTRGGQKIDKDNEIIKSKADIVYVDRQDAGLNDQLRLHEIRDDQKQAAVLELIKSMDRKIDILIQSKQ